MWLRRVLEFVDSEAIRERDERHALKWESTSILSGVIVMKAFRSLLQSVPVFLGWFVAGGETHSYSCLVFCGFTAKDWTEIVERNKSTQFNGMACIWCKSSGCERCNRIACLLGLSWLLYEPFVLYGQVIKRTGRMPWQSEAKKDAGACDKRGGAGTQALIPRFPNGETQSF